MPIKEVVIIGGGIAGIASAIALTKFNGFKCSVFEIRSEPATIGGAINLTPNALRYLDHLGALPRLQPKGCEVKYIEIISHRTGQPLGRINYDNLPKFKHRALRAMRSDVLQALLDVLSELGVKVQYGKKMISLSERGARVSAIFEDGTTAEADILLGCDGVHSAVRTKFIQPDRKPEYTGVATGFGFLNAGDMRNELPIDATSLFSGRYGSVLLSYVNSTKSRLYVGAVMGAEDVGSREGWIVRGQDQDRVKQDLLRRFSGPATPFFKEVVERLGPITLYPVFRLPGKGVWHSDRILLLGDAAHAMPPQGESVGLALEDTILLSRILERNHERSVTDMFSLYDHTRRPRINAAVEEANFGFDTIKDSGWLTSVIMDWLTWIVLAWRGPRKEEEFAFDVRTIPLNF